MEFQGFVGGLSWTCRGMSLKSQRGTHKQSRLKGNVKPSIFLVGSSPQIP